MAESWAVFPCLMSEGLTGMVEIPVMCSLLLQH